MTKATKKTSTQKAASSAVASKGKTGIKTAAKKANNTKNTKPAVKKASPKTKIPKIPAKKAAKTKRDPSELLADLIVHGMEEKKADNIVVMDMREVPNTVTDFFVICQAESTTQVAAIADSVWEEVRKATGEKPWHSEGFDNAQWILLDYVSVVAHVFQPEARYFYNIEKLWGDAKFKYITR